MKWLGLASVILSFPVVLWIIAGNPFDHDPKSSTIADFLPIPNNSSGASEARPPSPTSDMDLRAASALTIKKINEIDEKIAAAQVELRKNQSNRNAVVQDLLKIQAKIDAIVKAESNL